MTHVNDGVTDDIVWIQGTRMPWFNKGLGSDKRKNKEFEFKKLAGRQAASHRYPVNRFPIDSCWPSIFQGHIS